jgi:hypothetical protein
MSKTKIKIVIISQSLRRKVLAKLVAALESAINVHRLVHNRQYGHRVLIKYIKNDMLRMR